MKLITFEGIEGAGKSTQIKLLSDYLMSLGFTVSAYREPGSSDSGEEIRKILLNKELEISNITELLLMFASRSELVQSHIQNSKTDFVLLDRYYHASIAYQGFGRGIYLDSIYLNLQQLVRKNLINAINAPKPDLTFLLDISPEEGFARKQNHQKDRIESSGLTFFNDVRKGYIQLADENDFFYKIVVSDKSIEEIFKKVKKKLQSIL